MGTIQHSQFDVHLERIKELLDLGLSVRKMATRIGHADHRALTTSLQKRKLREPRPSLASVLLLVMGRYAGAGK